MHPALPDAVFAAALRPMPGMQPGPEAIWVAPDAAFAGQMRVRDALVRDRPGQVMAQMPGAAAGLAELLEVSLEHLADVPGYVLRDRGVRRPDGVEVALAEDPLRVLARLVQEDLCLLLPGKGGHVLAAASLCFPAGWRLSDKIGRALPAVHAPVPGYDAGIAARVQRLFDGVQAGRPMWRANLHGYVDPRLFQPVKTGPGLDFARAERQGVTRLARTGAVVFSIRSHVVAWADLGPGPRGVLEERCGGGQ